MSRYDLSGGEDAEFEPNSNHSVLRNKLGITDEHEIQAIEFRAYKRLTMESLGSLDSDESITVEYIRALHGLWLQDVYDFAGEYRTVDMSKGGFMFCHAQYIQQEMQRYEQILSRCTPCDQMAVGELATAMAEVHGEFILIHPFREGNGRLGRWVMSLMAAQAGYPLLSFEPEANDAGARESYFQAIRRYASDPSELNSWVSEVLSRTP